MRFNANRLARLAGLSNDSGSGVLREGRQLQELQNSRERDEYGEDGDYGDEMLAEDRDDDDEVLEISETMLRDEIRRMRVARLNESRTRQSVARKTSRHRRRRQDSSALQEAKLRKEIRSQISEIFEDLQLTSKWIYGKNLPRRSSPGRVTMGAPGIGFKNFK